MEWNNVIHVTIIEIWVQVHTYVMNVLTAQIQSGKTLYVRQHHVI